MEDLEELRRVIREIVREVIENEYALVENRDATADRMHKHLYRALLNYYQLQLGAANGSSREELSHWWKEVTACFDQFGSAVRRSKTDPTKILAEIKADLAKSDVSLRRRAESHLGNPSNPLDETTVADFWSRAERIAAGEEIMDVCVDWFNSADGRPSNRPPRL